MLRRIAILTIAILLSSATGVFAQNPLRVIEGIVTKVVDGDTIHVVDNLGTKVKVRLYGIDAPETEKKNRSTGKVTKAGMLFGEEAFQALQTKVTARQVKLDVMAVDRYGRTVAVVKLENRDINHEMVTDGWAWAYKQYLDRPHASIYIGAEEEARLAKRGLWHEVNPQPPWEFRRASKKTS